MLWHFKDQNELIDEQILTHALIYLSFFFLSFEQLKIGANNLKKQATKKNEGSLAYVKGGLSTFFEAQDALAGKRD